MSQSYRLKISRPSLKLRVSSRIPNALAVDQFLTLAKANNIYTFGIDYELIGEAAIIDPTTAMIVVLDRDSDSYKLQSISTLLAGASQIDQHITAAGPVAVLANAGIVRVDQTVGAAMTLTLPLASAKTCPVLISDWKGDAGTNNITINLSGSDKFPGNLTSWIIGADTGSVFFRPIAGAGYAL